VGEYSFLRCPVHDPDTDMSSGFRVDMIRSSPSYRNGAWHDDVSLITTEGGDVTFGRVSAAFRMRLKTFRKCVRNTLYLAGGSVFLGGSGRPRHPRIICSDRLRCDPVVQAARTDNGFPWLAAFEVGRGRVRDVLLLSYISEPFENGFEMVSKCMPLFYPGRVRDSPVCSVMPMSVILKKELVMPGFGSEDEKINFWVNHYAWISGRSTSK
jgi:hypothetical protein